MKTVILTDEEVQVLRKILNENISKYLDDFCIISSGEVQREFNPKAEVFMSIYNKIVTHVFKV